VQRHVFSFAFVMLLFDQQCWWRLFLTLSMFTRDTRTQCGIPFHPRQL